MCSVSNVIAISVVLFLYIFILIFYCIVFSSVRLVLLLLVLSLTHVSLASILWDIGKQCRTREDAAECESNQALCCLLT